MKHPVIIPIDADPFAPRASGTVQYALQLARELSREGHDVAIWAAGSSGKIDGVHVERVVDAPTREVWFALALRRKARSLVHGSPCVVIANGEHYAAAFSPVAQNCRTVLAAHGPVAPSLRRRRPVAGWFFERFIERKAVAACALIIAIDSDAEGYFATKYPNKPVVRIPIGVDLERFSPGDRRAARAELSLPLSGEFVLVAARPVREKGLELAGEAISRVSSARSEVHLVFAGAGHDDPAAKSLGSRLANDRFHPLGVLDHERMAHAYRASDVLLLTSREEQLPTVVIEALACGIPVVATPVGDIPRLLRNPMAGRCVPPDPMKLANALGEYLTAAQSSRVSVSAACRATAVPYSWDRIGREVSRICETVWETRESNVSRRDYRVKPKRNHP